MTLVHWPLVCGLLHLVQRGWDWAGPQPAQAPPRYTKCNRLIACPSTASVPITALLYTGPLLCGFNVPVKGLRFDVILRLRSLCLSLFYPFFITVNLVIWSKQLHVIGSDFFVSKQRWYYIIIVHTAVSRPHIEL